MRSITLLRSCFAFACSLYITQSAFAQVASNVTLTMNSNTRFDLVVDNADQSDADIVEAALLIGGGKFDHVPATSGNFFVYPSQLTSENDRYSSHNGESYVLLKMPGLRPGQTAYSIGGEIDTDEEVTSALARITFANGKVLSGVMVRQGAKFVYQDSSGDSFDGNPLPDSSNGCTAPNASRSGLIERVDFENGSLGPTTSRSYINGAVRINDTSNSRMASFQIRKGDSGVINGKHYQQVERALVVYNDGIAGGIGDERWFGFRVELDDNWNDTSLRGKGGGVGTIVYQVHDDLDSGESSHSPQLALHAIEFNGKLVWLISNISDSDLVSRGGERSRYWVVSQPLQLGKLSDWVIRAKWSHRQDGVLQVWKDGSLVVNYNGPNAYNSRGKGRVSYGVYNPSWDSTKNGVNSVLSGGFLKSYFDELYFGHAGAGFADVAPSCLR